MSQKPKERKEVFPKGGSDSLRAMLLQSSSKHGKEIIGFGHLRVTSHFAKGCLNRNWGDRSSEGVGWGTQPSCPLLCGMGRV